MSCPLLNNSIDAYQLGDSGARYSSVRPGRSGFARDICRQPELRVICSVVLRACG